MYKNRTKILNRCILQAHLFSIKRYYFKQTKTLIDWAVNSDSIIDNVLILTRILITIIKVTECLLGEKYFRVKTELQIGKKCLLHI